VSPTLISAVTEAVREELNDWQSRPLEAVYPVIWLDALVVKVRDQGVVRNRAAHVAIGLTLEGHKQVLGLWFESNEGAKFWLRVLTELRNRGVKEKWSGAMKDWKRISAQLRIFFEDRLPA
jgi:putative transposase